MEQQIKNSIQGKIIIIILIMIAIITLIYSFRNGQKESNKTVFNTTDTQEKFLEYYLSDFSTGVRSTLFYNGDLIKTSDFDNSCRKKKLSMIDINTLKKKIIDQNIPNIKLPEDSMGLICEGSEYLILNNEKKQTTIEISCTAQHTIDAEKIRDFVNYTESLGGDFEDCK